MDSEATSRKDLERSVIDAQKKPEKIPNHIDVKAEMSSRKSLRSLLKEEYRYISSPTAESTQLAKYIEEHSIQIVDIMDDGYVEAQIPSAGCRLVVKFNSNPDEKEEEEEYEHVTNKDEDDKPGIHMYTVDITPHNASTNLILRLHCQATETGDFALQGSCLLTPEQIKEADANTRTRDYSDLDFRGDPEIANMIDLDAAGEEVRNGIMKWARSLGIDHRISLFVQIYSQELKKQLLSNRLKKLRKFLDVTKLDY